jgi:4-hydroxybenzoate polyprenyltransferase
MYDVLQRVRSIGATLLFSNLFIGGAAAALTRATGQLLRPELAAGWIAPAFVLCSTLIVYNLDRLVGGSDAEDDVDATVRHQWIERSARLLWGVIGVSTIAASTLVWWLPLEAFWVLAPMGLLAIGYAVPIYLPGLGTRRLKEVSGLKMALIVVVWSGATVLLPAIIVDRLADPRTWVIAGLRGLFIFALTLPFDLRDVERDRRAGIRTIPHLVGRVATRWLAVAAITAFAVISVGFFGIASEGPGACYLTTAIMSLPIVAYADVERPEWYFVGLVDGMILVHAGILWLWLP